MSSDSDDDLPIAELIKKRKIDAGTKIKEESKSKMKGKAETQVYNSGPSVKKEKEALSAPSKRATRPTSSDNGGRYSSSIFYEDTEKGKMVQSLLVRWWYAIEWPTEKDIGAPPPGYESLDGFKGVFISTRTDSLGEILDLRDKTTCPNLINISSYHAVKVQQLLVKALESQIEVLRNTLHRSGQEARDEDDEEDEDDTKRSESEKLIKELQTELRSVKKLDANKAENAAKHFSFGKK